MCSASVIQRIRPERIDLPVTIWLGHTENLARKLKLGYVRIYLTRETTDWTRALQHRGYRRKVEFLLRQDVSDFETDHLHLVPVDTPEAWHSRVTLFQHDRKGMDGHDLLPVAWNELERRKAATGELHCLTAIHHDRCVGAVSFMRTRHFLRVKNLFVHPLHRRQGVAMAMLKWMHEQARLLHMRSVCLMAVDGSPAIDLYRLMGMEIVGEQYEWIKPIDPG